MNLLIKLRREREEKRTAARGLVLAAEAEERDLTGDEQASYDELLAEIEALNARIERLEQVGEGGEDEGRSQGRGENRTRTQAPGVLKFGRGDDETRALAHFIRTGDLEAMRGLVERDEKGVPGVTLRLPSQAEMRAVSNSTMNITTAADGGSLVPTGFVQDIARRKNERMLAPLLGVRNIPGKGTTVNHPVEGADPEAFATTDEQNDAHEKVYERDAGVVGNKGFTLVKKTRKIELTEELLEDNDVPLMDYISDRIGRQMAKTHNAMLIAEVGSHGSALATLGSVTGVADKDLEKVVFGDTIGYYLDDGSDPAWVMRHSTFGQVASISGDARIYAETPAGSRSNRSLLGYPVFHSSAVAPLGGGYKSLFFGDWNQVGMREAPELRFIQDPYSVDGMVILKYSFRAAYGVLQAGAIGFATNPTA